MIEISALDNMLLLLKFLFGAACTVGLIVLIWIAREKTKR